MYSRPPEARGYKWSEMHLQANPASKISDLGGPLDVFYCSYNQLHIITKNLNFSFLEYIIEGDF